MRGLGAILSAVGLLTAVTANRAYYRRTRERVLSPFFLRTDVLTRWEYVGNRLGLLLFVGGIIATAAGH